MTQADSVHSTPPTSTSVRIPRNQQRSVLRVGSLELDLTNRTLRRGGRSFELKRREFRFLKYMMEKSGQLVTRAEILHDVWGYKFLPDTNTVAVHLCRLRRKVDAPNEPQMICTVRGAGFILNVTDEAATEIDPAEERRGCDNELRYHSAFRVLAAYPPRERQANPRGSYRQPRSYAKAAPARRKA
jgi:DNA-binding winged helix-turn-helix (wHTH) protein